MEDGELNSLIEGLSNANQTGQLVLSQQQQPPPQQNPQQTQFIVSPYPAANNAAYLSSATESPFPTPSPSPSIVLRSPAPVKSPITNLQNIKSPIPVKSPGFPSVKSPGPTFQNVKSPTPNFQNVKSPSLYQVKSPGVGNIKSPAPGVVKSPANIRSPGVCNPQSPAQAHSPFQHQVGGSPGNGNSNRSPAPPPPTPSPTTPSPRPNTPQPVVTQFPPNATSPAQHVPFTQTGQIIAGRAQIGSATGVTVAAGGGGNGVSVGVGVGVGVGVNVAGTMGGNGQHTPQLPKAKQPLQILPKPLATGSGTQKQTVPRLNASSMPQQTPLLINQPQNASPALVLNQVLTSGAPVLVQPAGPGGTVHLMLRPPTPTLQSGPGPPQNKMIIANAAQPQAQATVLIPNRQQVMRIMTPQGPMQLQQIQTPSGPQFIAIPQNQALSFPANSVLLQSSPSNAIQVQSNGAGTLQLQQNATGVLQSSTFPPTSLPLIPGPITLPNQIIQATAPSAAGTTTAATALNKRDEKGITTDGLIASSFTLNDQKKIVIDNKVNSKKNANCVNINVNSAVHGVGVAVTGKKGKKGKIEEDALMKPFVKDGIIVGGGVIPSATVSTATTAQKNITSSLRQVRPGAFANRNRQNLNAAEAKDKTDETTNKTNLNNLTRIIDSVASNTEHLISPPPPKVVDNLTATINSVAENVKAPVPDEIMSNLSFSDVFIAGNKTLSLNKRPNLTIVQKQMGKAVPESPSADEPNLTINRLETDSYASTASSDATVYESMVDLGGIIASSAGVQTNEASNSQSFLIEQNSPSNSSGFASQEETKKGRKKGSGAKKKGRKEENKVDLWDLMKSAGIGDDEFDDPPEVPTYNQGSVKVAEGLEISSADTELLAQLQSATQLPNNIRVVVGEDGRPVFFNGSNVLVPEAVQEDTAAVTAASTTSTTATAASAISVEATDADASSVLQNMIVPENVFNFTPQALATAQTQLNQLIQDHGSIAASSADQQLLSQIFGPPTASITTNASTAVATTTATITPTAAAVVQSATVLPPQTPTQQQHPQLVQPTIVARTETVMAVSSTRNEPGQMQSLVQAKPVPVQVPVPAPAPPPPPPPPPPPQPPPQPEAQPQPQPEPQVQPQPQTAPLPAEAKAGEFIGGPPPGLPPLGPDSLVITNNNGVPTLVASPALMQYLQTHQGIIQFQHDPVTKTIQPSLIIPHPQAKVEVATTAQDIRNDKIPSVVVNARTPINQPKDIMMNKPRVEHKSSVGTTTDNPTTVYNAAVAPSGQNIPSVTKLNMVKFYKNDPPLLQIAAETSNLIAFKETNKTLSEREVFELERKIQHNQSIMEQFKNRTSIQEGRGNEAVFYMLSTTDAKLLEKSQMAVPQQHHLPVESPIIKTTPTPNSDFQTKFLESIGMANKVTKASVGTTTAPVVPAPISAPTTTSPAKRGRKKKTEKVQSQIQNQATQVDGKMEMMFNIAQLTPEQNKKLNQALQARGVTASQVHNFDAIKQIIQEEIGKVTAGALANTSIRFVNAPQYRPAETVGVGTDTSTDQRMTQTTGTRQQSQGVVYNSPGNVNTLLDQSAGQGNIISLQGSDVVAINNGNQRIFASQNQILPSGHIVASNNQILAIGSNPNQLVSLGNPISSSNQIMTLGNPPGVMSVNGNNVTTPGSVIVGSNGNVVAIVHQTPAGSGQGSGLVQRLQAIQLTTPKQQHFKTVQSQIQTLTLKGNLTASEQSTLQKLILEQQKILSTGRLVTAPPGSLPQGVQIVSQPLASQPARFASQAMQHAPQDAVQHHIQAVGSGSLQQPSPGQMYITTSANTGSAQPCKTSFTTQTAVSSGSTGLGDVSSKLSAPPTLMISDAPTPSYGPLYVSPNTSGKNVTKCEKGTSPIQIQMGTQTVANMEYRSGKMSTGTMTSPNTGKPQAVVAPAIVIQQTETPSPTWQMKPRSQQQVQASTQVTQQQQAMPQQTLQAHQQQSQQTSMSPVRTVQPQTPNRTAFIEQQMRTDQAGATMPDTRTPFLSKSDACKRLIRYHVMDEKALSPQDLAAADDMFEATAQHLLEKFRVMKEKYKYLLLLESMREVSTAERIMVDRNFIIEERIELEEMREREKRLQEEFDNPTICYATSGEPNIMKTEFMYDDVKPKKEVIDSFCPMDEGKPIKAESDEAVIHNTETDGETDGSKRRPGDPPSAHGPDPTSFKMMESNRNYDLSQMKSEAKECKNTRQGSDDEDDVREEDEEEYEEEEDEEDDDGYAGGKCKAKTGRTFSDGSSKSSIDGTGSSGRDEDSGTDINAQVQSAIDSILNLQKRETLSNDEGGGRVTPKRKKKRRHGDRDRAAADGAKRLRKESGVGAGAESDYDDECASDADHLLDEAIRSIMTS